MPREGYKQNKYNANKLKDQFRGNEESVQNHSVSSIVCVLCRLEWDIAIWKKECHFTMRLQVEKEH